MSRRSETSSADLRHLNRTRTGTRMLWGSITRSILRQRAFGRVATDSASALRIRVGPSRPFRARRAFSCAASSTPWADSPTSSSGRLNWASGSSFSDARPNFFPPQLGNDALQTPLRLLRLCKRCLGLGELLARRRAFSSAKGGIGHGPDQGTGLRR